MPVFSEAERAALRVALTGGQRPSYAMPADMAALRQHSTDEQIVEIGASIALFGVNNCWNALIETDVEPEVTAFLEQKRFRGSGEDCQFADRQEDGGLVGHLLTVAAKWEEKLMATESKLNRRGVLAGLAAGLAALQITVPGSALGQSYPSRSINLMVMYSAGGGTDPIMRKWRLRRAGKSTS